MKTRRAGLWMQGNAVSRGPRYRKWLTAGKNTLTFGFVSLVAILVLMAPNARATVVLTVSGCTAGCTTPPYATITLLQDLDLISVDVTVTLGTDANGPYHFHHAPDTKHHALAFDLSGDPTVTISGLTAGFAMAGTLPGSFNSVPFGTFSYAIDCPGCGSGYAGGLSGPLQFKITPTTGSLTPASFIANSMGHTFAVDIVDFNNNSGNVSDVALQSAPEPATAILVGTSLLAFSGVLRRRRRVRRKLLPAPPTAALRRKNRYGPQRPNGVILPSLKKKKVIHRYTAGSTLALCALFTACSSKELTRSKAAELMRNEFRANSENNIQHLSLIPYQTLLDADTQLKPLEPLEKAGWITIMVRRPFGFEMNVVDIALTEEGKKQSLFWKRDERGIWKIPTANRELVEVIDIAMLEPTMATAEYRWQWVPTDSQKLLGIEPSEPLSATATFRLYGDGWRRAP